MLKAYPIILEPAEEGGYIVTIPDFDVSTQGDDYAEALFMARDAIGLCGIDLMDDKKPIPAASDFDSISIDPDLHQVKLMVDVDFAKYRRENDTRAVRKIVRFRHGLMKKPLSRASIFHRCYKTD